MSPDGARRGGVRALAHRLPVRVAAAAALWLLPSFASLVEPMTASQTSALRELAVTVLVVSVTSWVASQGKRRRELVGCDHKAEPQAGPNDCGR